jgi:hypothetical protein
VSTHLVGRWIDVDPREVVVSTEVNPGVQGSPSPYDIPLALRVNEGDPGDPVLVVELRYLGGREPTVRKGVLDVEVELGAGSGRVHAIRVDARRALHEGRRSLGVLKRAIAELEALPIMTRPSAARAHYQTVRRAVELHERDLLRQLQAFGHGQAAPFGLWDDPAAFTGGPAHKE